MLKMGLYVFAAVKSGSDTGQLLLLMHINTSVVTDEISFTD